MKKPNESKTEPSARENFETLARRVFSVPLAKIKKAESKKRKSKKRKPRK
jgi:hypothetical protein